jgi:predicted DNA-binding transcriptional regulator YafY
MLLLSQGAMVKAVAPDEFVQEMRDAVRAVAELY